MSAWILVHGIDGEGQLPTVASATGAGAHGKRDSRWRLGAPSGSQCTGTLRMATACTVS